MGVKLIETEHSLVGTATGMDNSVQVNFFGKLFGNKLRVALSSAQERAVNDFQTIEKIVIVTTALNSHRDCSRCHGNSDSSRHRERP